MRTIKTPAILLGELDQPVINDYELGILLFRIYQKSKFRNEPVTGKGQLKTYYNRQLKLLINYGILTQRKEFPDKRVFQIIGKKKFDAYDVICSADPFSFISHLSAMSFHGLTDRLPSTLFYSTPESKDWRHYANEKMLRDLGDDYEKYKANNFPLLRNTKVAKVGKLAVHKFSSKQLGNNNYLSAYKNMSERPLRISTIGRTFLEMVQKPDLCGGIRHVMETYQQNGKNYFRLIFEEINRHGKAVDKVRAGYLLSEIADLDNPQVAEWEKFVQRGGSRKLDYAAEYSSEFSERWSLSINVD